MKNIAIITLALLAALPLRGADIITCKETVPAGGWVCFRKTFNLAKQPGKNSLRIAADSKYWLYVNGELVVREGQLKRGPNPNDTYIDSLGLDNLQKGSNTVMVLVNYFGKSGYSHRNSPVAGLYFDLRADNAAVLASDKTWKAILHPAYYIPTGQKPNVRLPESNVGYDARKETESFASPRYNDSGWGNAVAVAAANAKWGNFVVRPIPFFKDYGVSEYLGQTTKGSETTCRLPYNAQVSPILKVSAPAGKVIGIRTDNYPATGSEYIVRYEYTTREGEQEFEFPGWINGHSVIYTIPEGVKVERLAYRETGYNCDLAGATFECSDEELTKLWRKAQRTLYVTMRDNFMDCPDRERAQYIGDVTNEVAEAPYALSDEAAKLISKCAHEFVDWQRSDNVLYAPVPAGDWNKELPQQSLAFCGMGLWDYYRHYGDEATIRKAFPAIKRYLHLWTIGADGLASYRRGAWDWGDWGTNTDMAALNQEWYSLTLDRYAKMAALCGDEAEAAWASKTRQRLNVAFNAKYWNGSAYSSKTGGTPDDRAQGLAVVAGMVPEENYAQIRKQLASTQFASPYMERHVLEALCEMGFPQDALQRMRRRYRQMADSQYTTLWERFELATGTSNNHAWSGAPLIVLSRHIAGITPLKPQFAEFQVRPQLCDLEYLNTTVPTPAGQIGLKVARKDGLSMTLDVPTGTTARLLLPAYYTDYRIDGKKEKMKLADGTDRYELHLTGGSHTIAASLADTTAVRRRLASVTARLRYLRDNLREGGEPGCVAPGEFADAFASRADSVIRLATKAADGYEAVARLIQAESLADTAVAAIVQPKDNQWFMIMPEKTYSLLLSQGIDTTRFPLSSTWVVKTNADGKSFSLSNAADGRRLAGDAMLLLPGMGGNIVLADTSIERFLYYDGDEAPFLVETEPSTLGNLEFSYMLMPMQGEVACYRDTAEGWNAVVVPAQIDSVAGGVALYRVAGLQRTADGAISAVLAEEISRSAMPVAAATPVAIHADSRGAFTLFTTTGSVLCHTGGRANGLVGVADTTSVPRGDRLFFEGGELVASNDIHTLFPGESYIDPLQVGGEAAADAAVIPVRNALNAINSATAKSSGKAPQIYTIDAAKINSSNAVQPGIYIVDGEKKLVR